MKKTRLSLNSNIRLLLPVLLYLASINFVYAQHTVSGRVNSDEGEPLPGVNIVLKGTQLGVVTDVNGRYNLTVNDPNGTLIFSFIGFVSEEVPINSRSVIDLVLTQDIQSLSEVVVVGYGVMKKSDLTGAVTQLDGERLQQMATSDPNQALQGRIAGVQIVNNSGAPAAGQRVRIRGVGSLRNSDPLYVVDGFPVNDISNIPPADIKSIEVLKDASATAIYGSRGANGVIMVTTVRGQEGKTKFNLNAYQGLQQAWRQIDMLNASEYATLRLEAFENDGRSPDAISLAKLEFVRDNNSVGTDWQKEIFTTGKVQNYTLGANGGSEAVRFNISGTYFRNDGIVKNTYLEKFFTRANIDMKLSERVTSGINLNFMYADYTPFNNSSFGGPLTSALKKDPITAVIDRSTGTWDRSNLSDQANPARIIDESINRTNTDFRLQAGAFIRAELIKNLSLTSQFTYDKRDGSQFDYQPQFFMTNNEQRLESTLYRQANFGRDWVNSNFLNYVVDVDKHSINATAGIEFNYFQNGYMGVTARDVPNDKNLRYIGMTRAPERITANDGENRYSIMSYFGRFNYAFDDRYIITGTIRRDGSSKFLGDYRWGIFPSVGAGWNVHNEDFFPQNDILNVVKLRGSWGKVGNERTVGPYSFLTLFDAGWNYTFGGDLAPGNIPTRLSNPNLRWETSRTTNFGVDLGFFQNKLTASIDYFNRKTIEMLYPQPTPGFAGALGGDANIGDMENKGLELSLEYRNQAGQFKYSIAGNATYLRTTVTDLGGGEPMEIGSESRAGGPTTRTERGQAPGYFYALKTDGIFQSAEEINSYVNADGGLIQPNAQPDDVKYVDSNGDGRIDFATDRVNLGNPYPTWTFGFSTFLEYKGFDLNILFNGSMGNKIANMMTFYLEHPAAQDNSLATRLNRWTPENPSNTEPRATTTDHNRNFLYSDRYIEDGSFVRLRNVQLGYTFPKSLVNRVGAGSLRVYISADNLLTFTKYTGLDPEIGNYNGDPLQAGVDFGSYPQARTIMGGININF